MVLYRNNPTIDIFSYLWKYQNHLNNINPMNTLNYKQRISFPFINIPL